jgi:PBP1b-binding outer membrane lipoprotein LpoB
MRLVAPALFSALLLAGCIHVKMDPIEVNANVNVNVRVDKALNDFFGDLDKQSSTLSTPSH